MSDPAEDNATRILDNLQEQAARVHAIYAPQWNARADLLKTIVSVSSAFIVLSFTFSTAIRSLHLGPRWSLMVVVSFGLFAIALAAALVGLWIGTRVYTLQSGVLDKRIRLREAAMTPLSTEQRIEALKQIFNEATRAIEKSDKTTAILVLVSGVPFFAAIAILAVVGGKQIIS